MKIFDRFKKALAPRVEFLTNLSQPVHIPASGMDGHKLTNSGGCPVKQPQKEVTQMTKNSGPALRAELARMNVSPEDREIYHQVIDSVVELERMYSAPAPKTATPKPAPAKTATAAEMQAATKFVRQALADQKAEEEFAAVCGFRMSGGE